MIDSESCCDAHFTAVDRWSLSSDLQASRFRSERRSRSASSFVPRRQEPGRIQNDVRRPIMRKNILEPYLRSRHTTRLVSLHRPMRISRSDGRPSIFGNISCLSTGHAHRLSRVTVALPAAPMLRQTRPGMQVLRPTHSPTFACI